MQGGMRQYNKEHPLRVFEAFSGYGSQSLAFEYLKDLHPDFEFEVVGISDIEEGLTDEQMEDVIAEHIFDWWISGKPYKQWYAEKFLQTKFEFNDEQEQDENEQTT